MFERFGEAELPLPPHHLNPSASTHRSTTKDMGAQQMEKRKTLNASNSANIQLENTRNNLPNYKEFEAAGRQ